MKTKARAIMASLVALGLHPLQAQYSMGIAGGTWEGIWGVGAQPACLTLNPDKAEINIIQGGIDLDNSYLYLGREQFGLFGFGRRIRVDTTELDLGELRQGTDRAVTLDARATAPSFSLRLGQRSAVALTNRVRIAFTALDLDDLARKFGIDTITHRSIRSRFLPEPQSEAHLDDEKVGDAWQALFGLAFQLASVESIEEAAQCTLAMLAQATSGSAGGVYLPIRSKS
jgi:hypothetical protein